MNNQKTDIEQVKKISVDDLLEKLKTTEKGLSSNEIEKRRSKYGFNEIQEKKVHPVLKFLGYFWGPIPWMIEIAAVLSAVIQHWEDLIIISILLFANAIVGFWQENKADNAIELLKKKLHNRLNMQKKALNRIKNHHHIQSNPNILFLFYLL